MRLYLQKDKSSDQVYIGLAGDRAGKRGAVKSTVRATDDIALDFDAKGRLVGIDVSSASRLLGRRVFAKGLVTDELVGVAEAAKMCGVRKPNFLRDFAGKPDFPQPVAELASGRIWFRASIADYVLGRTGRRGEGKERPERRTLNAARPG